MPLGYRPPSRQGQAELGTQMAERSSSWPETRPHTGSIRRGAPRGPLWTRTRSSWLALNTGAGGSTSRTPGDPGGWCSHPLPDRGASPAGHHLKKQGVCWVLQRGGGALPAGLVLKEQVSLIRAQVSTEGPSGPSPGALVSSSPAGGCVF